MKKVLSIFLAIWLIGLCISIISCAACDGGGNTSYSYTCKVCDRKFSGGTSNSKSIIRTGMCSQCYKNYKYAIGD